MAGISELMRKVRANVLAHERVGVAISGGLDSTVILHEVAEKNDRIRTYCMKWGEGREGEENGYAGRIAAAYGARHLTIDFNPRRLLQTISLEMEQFDRPRWNLWPVWIVQQAKRDGIGHLYLGEGSDEILGYSDRCYIRGWISQVEHIWPVWVQAGVNCGVTIHAPFLETETSLLRNEGLPVTLQWHCGTKKEDLWDEYKDRLRAPVIWPKRPALHYYRAVARELGCDEGIVKTELLKRACQAWANTH